MTNPNNALSLKAKLPNMTFHMLCLFDPFLYLKKIIAPVDGQGTC